MYDLVSCTIDCTCSCLDVQLCYPHHFSCMLFTNVFHLEINKVNLTIYSLLQNIGCDMVFFLNLLNYHNHGSGLNTCPILLIVSLLESHEESGGNGIFHNFKMLNI